MRTSKLSPDTFLRLLKGGASNRAAYPHVVSEADPKVVVRHGIGGSLEASIVGDRKRLLRIEADQMEFTADELAWFVRLVERVARKKAQPKLRAI